MVALETKTEVPLIATAFDGGQASPSEENEIVVSALLSPLSDADRLRNGRVFLVARDTRVGYTRPRKRIVEPQKPEDFGRLVENPSFSLLRGLTREQFYLVNRETRRGRPAQIVLGDPMREMLKLLPEPGELAA